MRLRCPPPDDGGSIWFGLSARTDSLAAPWAPLVACVAAWGRNALLCSGRHSCRRANLVCLPSERRAQTSAFPFPLFISISIFHSCMRVHNFPRLRRSCDCRSAMSVEGGSRSWPGEGFGLEGFEMEMEMEMKNGWMCEQKREHTARVRKRRAHLARVRGGMG